MAFAAAAVASVQLMDLVGRVLERAPGLKRAFDVIQLICCMCCAWCCYYGGKRLLIMLLPESAAVEALLRVVLAVLHSTIAIVVILTLNGVLDRRKVAKAVANEQKHRQGLGRSGSASMSLGLRSASMSLGLGAASMSLSMGGMFGRTRHKWWRKTADLSHRLVLNGSKTLVKATAILIGFSWEQAFDEAVAKTCERTPVGRPVWARLILAALLAMMILPAWRLYILPRAHADAPSEVRAPKTVS